MSKVGDLTEDKLWNKINAGGVKWWKDIPLLPWAERLVEEMGKLCKVCILSSPGNVITSAPNAAAGKVLWMDKNFPDIPYILAYEKGLAASKKSVLIDDSKKKVKKFTKGGGSAFLWPVQYLIEDGEENIDDLIDQLKKLIKQL